MNGNTLKLILKDIDKFSNILKRTKDFNAKARILQGKNYYKGQNNGNKS